MVDSANKPGVRGAELSLAMPCYNEAEALRSTATRLIRHFRDEGVRLELVMVDNGSTDRTGEIIDELVDEGLPVVKATVPVNKGYGNGVLTGLDACSAPWVGFVCADGQVSETEIVRLYKVACVGGPKLAKVRRRFRMDGWNRKLISIAYNSLINLLFGGLGSIDINGNPKILPADAIQRMDLQSEDWFLDAEVMIKAKQLGLPVFEMNVLAQMREGGTSNVQASTCAEFLRNLWRARTRGLGTLASASTEAPAVGSATAND